MKKIGLSLLTLVVVFLSFSAKAQNNKNVGIGTSNPDPSAILDISSTDKGILIPRLNSAQITAINTPGEGLMVYNLDSNCYFYYNHFQWVSLCHVGTASNGIHVAVVNGEADFELGGPLTQNTDIPLSGKKLTLSTTGTGGNVGIGNNNPDPSAILDLSNNNNVGLVVPKVALTQTTTAAPVVAPVTDLMVYNTATQNDVKPGYYFWDGTEWMRLFSSNLPVVSTVSVTAPIVNTGTAQDPNIGITTSDLTSTNVIAVTGGANRLTGAGGAALDVVGTSGGVLYGTGTSSSFTPAGNTGEILKSNGSAIPTWVDPNSTLAKTNITGSPVLSVTNGSGQLVGVGNAALDVVGGNGGVLYGTGSSSSFTPAGASGQYLQSNGAAAPTWVNGSAVTGGSVVNITNGNQQVVGGAPMNIDVNGPQGTVLYGTGASSLFTAQGNTGELLQSNGTSAPSWISPNNALVKSDLTGSTVISVTTGANKLVGAGGANVDVKGTSGGVLYGTGASSNFTPVGTSGQYLKSTGATAPAWTTGSNINGSTVVAITNGSNQVLGSNVGIDVTGTNGGVMYGTGASSNFTPAGTSGQVLQSTGANAPVWASPNATLTTKNVVGSTVLSVTNGVNQVVGTNNMNLDVTGTNGGVLYGTGASSNFSAAGTAGQILKSSGAGAPTWNSTSNVTGGTVMAITNGAGQVVSGSNLNLDVAGANGGVMYGTGASSNFTPAGTSGQVLKSTGAGAPVWSSPNATLTTNDVVPAASSTVVIGNGTGQVVGGVNMTVDVQGTNGGVMYGKGAGTAAAFNAVGTTGQILKSNGAAALTWVAPNTTLTTNNVTGGTVMAITNGTGQVVGGSNLNVDVTGTNGGVLYGTGASSAFSAAGTSGQILKSNGAAAPTWVSPNTTLTTKDVTTAGNGVIAVTNGTGQVVGAVNATLDVTGTNGGVLYGTGASSSFSAAGTSGQILKSNGAAAPTWVAPNTTLTTKDITTAGNGVVVVTSGANQVVGAVNSTLDVAGANGGVMYGTGASSNFTPVGTSGQILKSNGAAAPTWVAPNSTLTTTNIVGSGPVSITNGSAQTVGVGNPTINVTGTAGTVLYGTGASSAFNAVGTSGQVLQSTGAGAPTWVGAASLVNVDNGIYYNGTSQTLRLGTNPLVENTTLTQAGFNFSVAGGTINLNDNSTNTVNIATNGSAGTVNVGTGASSQTVSIANGAGSKTLNLGSTNTTSATNINSGTAGVNINDANSQPTNINSTSSAGSVNIGAGTGANQSINIATGGAVKTLTLGSTSGTSTTNINSGSGAVNINNGISQATNINTGSNTAAVNIANAAASTGAVNIGTSNTEIVSGSAVGIGTVPTATEKLTVAGAASSGINASTASATAGRYAVHGSIAAGADGYLGYVGATPAVAANSSTSPVGYFSAVNAAQYGLTAATSGSAVNSAMTGLSSVWHGGFYATSFINASGIVALNNAGVNTGTGLGLLAQTSQSNGRGVEGDNFNANGIGTIAFNAAASGAGSGTAIYGQTAQSGGFAYQGYNTNANGIAMGLAGENSTLFTVAGSGAAINGTTYGIFTYSQSLVSAGIYTNQLLNGACRVNYYNGTQYKILGTGTVSTIVDDMNDKKVVMHAPETPEIYFQDYGSGQLVNGKAHITLDPTFAKNVTINDKHPLRVFVQLEGDCKGVYITNKTTAGFDVVELNAGTSDVAFQWSITCNRADVKLKGGYIGHNEDMRFEDAPADEPMTAHEKVEMATPQNASSSSVAQQHGTSQK